MCLRCPFLSQLELAELGNCDPTPESNLSTFGYLWSIFRTSSTLSQPNRARPSSPVCNGVHSVTKLPNVDEFRIRCPTEPDFEEKNMINPSMYVIMLEYRIGDSEFTANTRRSDYRSSFLYIQLWASAVVSHCLTCQQLL